MDAGIGSQKVQSRREWTKGVEWKEPGSMQCEGYWVRTVLVYVRNRNPQQGAKMAFTEHDFRPLHEPPKKQGKIEQRLIT
jgi:hypothetical protein